MNVFCYKMSWNTGFAPNPFFGVLALATCKPSIRRMAQLGDWIAGFTTKRLNPNQKAGEEKLIYLARVTERLTFAEYWQKYPMKRPGKPTGNAVPQGCGNVHRKTRTSNCGGVSDSATDDSNSINIFGDKHTH